jgi:hypothetical protein
MQKSQWLWMQASVALLRTAAMAMRRAAPALPPRAPAGELPALSSAPEAAGEP